MDRLIMARHGKSEDGGLDPLLNELGRKQATGIANTLSISCGDSPVHLVHSPKRRTEETAAYIGNELSADSEVNDALNTGNVDEECIVAIDMLLSEIGEDTVIFVTHEPTIGTYGRIFAERHGITFPGENEFFMGNGNALDLNLKTRSYRVLEPL